MAALIVVESEKLRMKLRNMTVFWLRFSSLLTLFSLSLLLAATIFGQSIEKRVIAFSSNRDSRPSTYLLYLMDVQRVLTVKISDTSPSGIIWLPDGRHILNTIFQGSTFEHFLIDINGDIQPFMTGKNLSQAANFVWSPDGTKIAYVSAIDGDREIYIMNADGSNIHQLTFTDEQESTPNWSPDGRQIAFSSEQNNGDIYIIDKDGNNLRQLTDTNESDGAPVWSPNGQQIMFTRIAAIGIEVYVISSDGTQQWRLPDDSGRTQNSSWSPDGQEILFTSTRNGNWDIYAINFKTDQLRQLTFNLGFTPQPDWSSDGKYIVFATTSVGNSDIYIINGDGSDLRRLTFNSGGNYYPAWQP